MYPSDFSSDDVFSCLWIVLTNYVFQVPPQKIIRRIEILGIEWPGVIGLTWNESVPKEVMPEVFNCSVREMRWRLISRTEHLNGGSVGFWFCENNPQTREDIISREIRWIPQEMLSRLVNNFNVRVAAVLPYSSVVHRTNIVLITEKSIVKHYWFYSGFPPKEFYKLPVTVEKKSWRFLYFCKSFCQRKIGTFLWATLYSWEYEKNILRVKQLVFEENYQNCFN